MTDFDNGKIWLREPMIDGELVRGGGLNRGMSQLSQMRDEVEVMQAAMGSSLASGAADLAARFAVRISGSGIRRAQVYAVRSPNATVGIKTPAGSWKSGGNLHVQFGRDFSFTTSPITITFPKPYFTNSAPTYIVCCPVSGMGANFPGIEVQPRYNTITTTTFQVDIRHWSAGGVWTTPDAAVNFGVSWVALGGFPSS